MAMTDAEKVENYRKMAQDKSLPQDVRDKYDERAREIETKNAAKAGVKLAKGGVVAKATAKKKMMYGGVAKKELPTRGSRTATNMAKGGAVKKAKK